MEWININTGKLPKASETVLICCKFGEIRDVYKARVYGHKRKQKIWFNPDTGFIYGGTVSHWMYQPELPPEDLTK